MDSLLGNLTLGFTAAVTLKHLAFALAGALIGTVVGVLPGLGPTAAMSLLLPLTFTLDPMSGIILLAGIWYGSQYGGSTTSILLNMPGEATSVVTAFDGYALARRGRGGAALFVAAVGSFFAGLAGLVGLALAAPPLAKYALAFGPPEYFAIAFSGLLILFNVTGGSPAKSALMAVLGMAVGTIGIDKVSGAARFAFGNARLLDGIDLAAVIMGVYGLSEVLGQITGRDVNRQEIIKVRFRDLYPNRCELARSLAPILRGSAVGFLIGLVPGPAGVIATFLSYRIEQAISPRKHEFGHGAIEGVAGPESANNAVTSASLIPLLSLGLPFSAPAAILLSGFIIHGIVPGASLISKSPELFWGLIASMVVGNIALLILNLPLVGAFTALLTVPRRILMPSVVILLLVGAYAASSSIITVWVAIGSGIAAWALRPLGYDPAPFVLGMILGPIMERALRQSLALSGGDVGIFFERSLSASIIAAGLVITLAVAIARLRAARRTRSSTAAGG